MIFVILLALFTQYIIDIILLLIGAISFYLFKTKIKVFDSENDNENTEKLLDYISKDSFSSTTFYHNGEVKPSNFCFSREKKYIAYISINTNSKERDKLKYKIYYLGALNIEITKNKLVLENNTEVDNKIIKVWQKASDFRDSWIYKLEIPFKFKPYSKQQEIINKIVSHWKNTDFFISRVLIYGNPGSGKSFIGKLLASELEGELATYINLGTPGCGFRHLYKKSSPKKDRPLIIQLDELDVIIENIHNQKNIKIDHDWLLTECYNKITYNNFWSEFVINYPYVIWLCTMNKTPNEIDKLDECYLRKNRIDMLIPYSNKDN